MKKLFLMVFFMQAFFMQAFAQMTDKEVIVWLKNAQNQGMNQQEMLMKLMQKGVTQEQLLRLKNSYENGEEQNVGGTEVGDRMRKPLQNTQDNWSKEGMRVTNNKSRESAKTPVNADMVVAKKVTLFDSLSDGMLQIQKENLKQEKKIFGRDIFNNQLLTFEPNLNVATPDNYILGPGDEVIVDIWGDAEQTLRQRISPDGTITDTKIGPVYLSGVNMRDANSRLKSAFSRIYSTISGSDPTTYINVSLGEIRSIRVNVMGEVQMPGTYTIPSLASLFHALYSAGGVNDIGSLRSVKVNRRGKELADIDVYDYILKGKSDLDIRLLDGDVIVVAPYKNLVSVKGKVKRPLIYEMKDTETVQNLLDYTGGFTGDAYKKAMRIIRKSGSERQVYNVDAADFGQFLLTDGDEVSIDSVLNRFENRVEIRGAVYREGLYSLNADVATVRQLIEKAEGVRGDAFINRAVLYRERPDFTLEAVGVDVRGLLSGKIEDIKLVKNDVLYIPAISDLREAYTVTVNGAVGIPGTYKYVSDMTIEDLVIQAGGLKESASLVKIDVARRIKNPKSMDYDKKLAENFSLTLKDGFIIDGQKDFVLMPFDQIYVRISPGYKQQQNVQIEGELLFPGTYVLSQKGERLSDLIKRAGGITPDAYLNGARLTRKLSSDEQLRREVLLKLTKQTGGRDSIAMDQIDIGDSYYVGIDLAQAMKNPGSEADVVLYEGDRLNVPVYNSTVKISGAIMYPNTVVYKKGATLKHYIEQGGGFADRAKKNKVFIVYMNGTVAKSKMFAKKLAPGCEIIVPLKPTRRGIGLAEIMSIASSTTSMAALVTSIINSSK